MSIGILQKYNYCSLSFRKNEIFMEQNMKKKIPLNSHEYRFWDWSFFINADLTVSKTFPNKRKHGLFMDTEEWRDLFYFKCIKKLHRVATI